MFQLHPLCGTGHRGFQPAIGGSTYYLDRTKGIVYSHNSYVLVLAGLGIVGLLLTGAFLGSCVAGGGRALARAPTKGLKALHAGLLAAVVANLVFLASYDSILYNLCLWVPLGMMVGGARASRKGSGAAFRREEPVSGPLRAPGGAS